MSNIILFFSLQNVFEGHQEQHLYTGKGLVLYQTNLWLIYIKLNASYKTFEDKKFNGKSNEIFLADLARSKNIKYIGENVGKDQYMPYLPQLAFSILQPFHKTANHLKLLTAPTA